MSIAINYLDPIQATIKMLKDYYDQKWKAEHGKERINQIQARMESVTANVGKDPVSGGGGNRAEEALIAGIDQKTIAEHGYQQALEYMAVMDACLARLTEQERRLLELRYIDYYAEGNGIVRIMEEFHVEKTKAYNLSNRALRRLVKLLFW